MAQQQIAGFAVLVALAFAIMALHGCANSEQAQLASAGPSVIAPIPPMPGTPEFHGARIGADTLRSRVPSDD